MLLMISVFLFSLLYTNGEDADKHPAMSPRIIHGKSTHITNYTHQARIDIKQGGFICGGTIIANNAILTAGHCTTVSDIIVRVGADFSKQNQQNFSTIEVKSVVLHPEFDSSTLEHDLAVILLKNNVTYGSKVGKIEMATQNGKFPQIATVVGWGCTTCIWFIPMWLCIFPASKELRFGELVLDKHLKHQFESTSRVKVCPGDSGGPVIDREGKLIGVISHLDVSFWKNRPNYFTSVPDHVEWIKKIIGE